MKKLKKVSLTVFFLFVITNVFSQDVLESFETTHATTTGMTVKMKLKIEVFKDKLVLNYLDKKTIKQMKKSNMDASIVFPYALEKKVNGNVVTYEFRNDTTFIQVIAKGNPTPSLVIKTKDDFTGNVTEQMYFSL